MALDDLKEIIATLRERIQAHRPYLEGYETRTRQVLIDPMLHALGWDVGDPNSVELEYAIKQQRVDYALMGSQKPIAVIEAKALGKPLDEKEMMQALNYANTAGIAYMTLTNGDYWQMIEVFKQAPIAERILMNFQLTQDDPYACALQALGLWRPNLASGEPPKEAATPIMLSSEHDQAEPAPPEPSSRQEATEPSNGDDWMPLASLTGKIGSASIKFPNSNPTSIKTWPDLLGSVVQYLVETGKLSERDCPIQKGRSKRYLVHTEPFHSDGKEFVRKQQVGNLWLYTYLIPEEIHSRVVWLLQHFGVDPATVRVRTNRS